MSQTAKGILKMKQTMIKKHGSEEAYREYMRSQGKLGGGKGKADGVIKGFATFSEAKIKAAGSKGGRISRRVKRNS